MARQGGWKEKMNRALTNMVVWALAVVAGLGVVFWAGFWLRFRRRDADESAERFLAPGSGRDAVGEVQAEDKV